MGAMQPAVVQFGLDQPLQVALREVPIPEIGPADVLLAVGAASEGDSGPDFAGPVR